MKDFKIQEINMQTDKKDFFRWDNKFMNTPEHRSIEYFVLEDGLFPGVTELIEENYEHHKIGNDELKKILIIKSEDGEMIGFLVYQLYEISSKKPSLLLQYVVISPEFQNQHYAKEILRELFTNSEKYFVAKPHKIFCSIEDTNYACQKLFLNFGFNLRKIGDIFDYNMFRAESTLPEIEKTIAQQSMH